MKWVNKVRLQYLKSIWTLLFLFSLYPLQSHAAVEQKPNIVVLLADDLGWNAVGWQNPEYETPHLDRLAKQGVTWEQFYVAPMCSPTRAGLMTGRYPIRFGCARSVIPPHREYGLPVEETTLLEALETAGYANRGVFGKWHLGHRRLIWHPLQQGATHFHGHYNGAIDYFQLTRDEQRDWHIDYGSSNETGYSTNLIGEASAQWIEKVAAEEAPYFCYVPFNAPHSPFQAPLPAIRRFAGKDATKEDASLEEIYKAMVWKMDQAVGKILAAIERTGEAENTIVWFFSDNGGVPNIPNLNKPLRGAKLTVYEGGVRVPACTRWPAKITAGSRSNLVCGYLDLFPSLLQAAGVDFQPDATRPLDGLDVLSMVSGGANEPLENSLVSRPWFSYHGQQGEQEEHLAVRSNGWKLKVNGPRLKTLSQLTEDRNSVELFHLESDPNEQQDLHKQHPDLVQELGQMLVEYRAFQPENAIAPYNEGRKGFTPPVNWDLPEALELIQQRD